MNRSLFDLIRENIMLSKQFIHRTVTYVSIINSGMILFLFLAELKERGIISFDLDKYFIPIFVIGFIVLLLIGWFEVRVLRGFEEESRIGFNFTPQFVEMHNKINYIYDKLEVKEKKK